jgi:cellulose synthase/poly-beta-1,6-N-acetylglucosamine synthase-like glycosyltransferase
MVSVLISTRDRPEDFEKCIGEILKNEYPELEVVVSDQSINDLTHRKFLELCAPHGEVCFSEDVPHDSHRRLRSKPRFIYHRSNSIGLSRSRNEGLARTSGDIIAFTDDDCTIPANWIYRAVEVLTEEPEVGVVFGGVVAAPHDWRVLFIPWFMPAKYERARRWDLRASFSGMGANMIVRRTVFEQIGGFDVDLGAGGRYYSAEDLDLSFRAAKAGFTTVLDPENVVVHWGAREYATGEAKRLMRRSTYGVGAFYGRHLRRADMFAGWLLLRVLGRLAADAIGSTVRLRRISGLGRICYFLTGVARGLADPRPTGVPRFDLQPEKLRAGH